MATITDLEVGTTGVNSRTIINTNFDNLNTDKAELSGATYTGLIQFSGTTHAGVKLNNLTTAQRDALTPAAGMTIYNTTTTQVEFYQAGAWTSLSGVSDASLTVKGVVELATTAEIDAGTATGGTSAAIVVTPDQLAASIYATRLPSAAQKTLLGDITASAAELNVLDGYTGSVSELNEMDTFFSATDISGAEAETLTNGSNADALHVHTAYMDLLSVNTAQQAFTNGSAERTLFTFTVNGGTLSTGNAIRFEVYVASLNSNSAAVAHTIRLKYGATTIATAAATVTTVAADTVNGVIRGVLAASGATNTQKGWIEGTFMENGGTVGTSGELVKMSGFGTGAEDSTANKTFTVTMQIADAGADITSELAIAYIIR